jgi:hypothetical protein
MTAASGKGAGIRLIFTGGFSHRRSHSASVLALSERSGHAPARPARRGGTMTPRLDPQIPTEVITVKIFENAGPIGGVAFAILLLFGFAVLEPLREATDQELISWWSEKGNQRDTAISMYFFLACVPCFLVFLGSLRSKLLAGEGGSGAGSALVFSLGICFAAAVLIASLSRGLIGHSVQFGNESLPGADVLRYITSFSVVLIGLVAVPAFALMIAVASWIAIRTGALAAWLGWLGLVVATLSMILVVLLEGPIASPLLQIWVVAASIELFRTRNRLPEGVPATITAPSGQASRAAV